MTKAIYYNGTINNTKLYLILLKFIFSSKTIPSTGRRDVVLKESMFASILCVNIIRNSPS